jgi:hypothetical protein
LFREEILHERKERLQNPRASFGVYVMPGSNHRHHIRKSLSLKRPKDSFTPRTNFYGRRENENHIVSYFTSIQSGIKVSIS